MSKSKKIAEKVSEVTLADEAEMFKDDIIEGGRGEQEHSLPPVAIVAGTSLDLVLCDPKDLPFGNYDWYVGNSQKGLYSDVQWEELSSAKEIWRATHNGMDIYLSRGSRLVVDSIGEAYAWEQGTNGKDGVVKYIILLGSTVTGSCLSASGKNKITNSVVNARYMDIDKLSLVSTRITAESNLGITDSYITNGSLSCKTISIYNGTIYDISLRTSGNIFMRDVRTMGNKFEISIYPYTVNGNIDINISNTVLTEFKYILNPDQELLSEMLGDNSFGNPTIEIKRRIDYGYFSAVDPVPFVRTNLDGILANSAYFKAEEFMTTSKPVEDRAITYGGFTRKHESNDYPEGCYIGAKIFRKLERVITGNGKNKFTPVGSNGNRLVNALHEQISSRLNLYVEAHLFD